MKFNFEGKHFWRILIGLGTIIILLLVFQLGMYIGFRKANFSYRWGENYHKTFGGPSISMIDNFQGRDLVNGHGITGIVAKVENGAIIMKDPNGVEKILNITPQTLLKRGSDTITITDVKIDDRLVVVGSPKNDGTIDAEIIRDFYGKN
ncbi:MAG: hypothetical protein JWO40_320 [Candidatus Doudnabacteria bacterium]|nr:hypothetical protein [Candidatus Doudnabacteria bacterium]